MAVTRSGYRQVRITISEQADQERPGRSMILYRVMVKPLEQQWNMRQTVFAGVARDQAPLATMDDVYDAVLSILRAEPLPGSVDS